MKQAVLTGPRRFRIDDVEPPRPGPGEVLVRVLMSGACASELEPWQAGENAPSLLGHEVAGEVAGVGDGVDSCRPGDLVTGLFKAGFSEFVVTPQAFIAPIPKAVGLEHAYGEPISCAMSAARRTHVELGDRICIVGLGFMGLLMLQMIARKGPAHVLGIDMREDALASGLRLGADEAIRPDELDEGFKAVFPFTPRGDPRGFDVVIEATGTQGGLKLAGELVRQHGVLSILGYHQGPGRDVDMQLWNFKAIDVVNAHERRADFRMDCMRRGLALAAGGRLELASLTTHTFPLENVGDAFAALESKPKGFIKSAVLI